MELMCEHWHQSVSSVFATAVMPWRVDSQSKGRCLRWLGFSPLSVSCDLCWSTNESCQLSITWEGWKQREGGQYKEQWHWMEGVVPWFCTSPQGLSIGEDGLSSKSDRRNDGDDSRGIVRQPVLAQVTGAWANATVCWDERKCTLTVCVLYSRCS